MAWDGTSVGVAAEASKPQQAIFSRMVDDAGAT